ncbi:MAG TPA: polymer-forming cytoskeletal protein [Planctomycetota bacterium]|nr:polymer-forming cytoskeletal protein [Planctomycetota bacterium]
MGIKPNAVELLVAGGAHQVPRPFLSGDDSLHAERLFDRVSSAPEGELPASSIVMEKRSRNGTGVFVVRARSGRHFKVALVDIERTPGAEPAARIRYEEVPARPGGGRVDGDAEGAVQRAAPVDLQEQLRSVQQAVRFTGESFASFLSGAYVSVSGLPAEFEPKGRSYLVLEEPLTTKITFDRYSGLVARAGIAREGHVAIKSYTGVLCRGDLSGTVDVNSYAFLQVDGNLTGTVNVDSYATVVVRGDITGTLEISSYVTLLLTGRVTGTLETKGWGSGKCFIDRHAFGSEAETLPGSGSVVLHLRESDLAEGRYEGIGAWKEVVVGGEAWKDAPR